MKTDDDETVEVVIAKWILQNNQQLAFRLFGPFSLCPKRYQDLVFLRSRYVYEYLVRSTNSVPSVGGWCAETVRRPE
jgi:hypothetical protein